MQTSAVRVTPHAQRPVATLFTYDCDDESTGVALPRPEVQLVARFGPLARGGLDVHAFGVRHKVHRKRIPRGMRAATARLQMGACLDVLGVTADVLADRIVTLEELWGAGVTSRLCDRLAHTRDTTQAAQVLEQAVAERFVGVRSARARLALHAAERLTHASVQTVAAELGVSERHLRRTFREVVGIGPKTYAKLECFHRALAIAGEQHASWASIAAAAGYYDQAHLIGEFRTIAGVTPRELIGELRTGSA